MQSSGRYISVTIDSAKNRAFDDLGRFEPLAQCSDRAGILVLAKYDRDLFAGLLLIGFGAR